jgi:hypothetical protein
MPIPVKPRSKRNTYNSRGYVVRVAEPALMQLCLGAMEAYVVGNPEAFEIETFGLLWGTARVHRASKKTFFSVEHASTHLSAKGDRDSVLPDMNAVRLQCDLMEKLWPQLGCLGSHHTHPYDAAKEVKAVEGWNPSPTDRAYFTGKAFRELRHRVSLITTVCKSSKSGNKASQFKSNAVALHIDSHWVLITAQVLYYEDDVFTMSADDDKGVRIEIPFLRGFDGGHATLGTAGWGTYSPLEMAS